MGRYNHQTNPRHTLVYVVYMQGEMRHARSRNRARQRVIAPVQPSQVTTGQKSIRVWGQVRKAACQLNRAPRAAALAGMGTSGNQQPKAKRPATVSGTGCRQQRNNQRP